MIIDRAEGKGNYRRYEFDGAAIVAAWPLNNMQGRKIDEAKVVRPSELKGEVRKAWLAAMKAFDGKSFNWEATAEEVAAASKFVKIEVRQASSVGGYAKPFVAKVTGFCEKYRLNRQFETADTTQHGGNWIYKITEDGIYHICDRNSKGTKREHFLKIEGGIESSITREEVESLFPVPEAVKVSPVDPAQPGKKEFQPENPIHRAQAAAQLAAEECRARGIEKDTDSLYLRAVLTFWNLIQNQALADNNTRASFEAAEQQIKFRSEWTAIKGLDWTPDDTITLEELKSIYSN